MDWSQKQIRLFRALLYCYPGEFRHEYGAEMELLFAERLQSERKPWLWLETLADVVTSALKEHWHILVSDVRYGTRVLASAPAFTGIALLVITLGIGATVSIFSIVNAVLLRSLPYGHPEQLVYLWSPNPNFKGVPEEMSPSVPDFYDWQRLSKSFSGMCMIRPATISLVRSGSTARVGAAFVTGTFFRVLQASSAMGRTLDPADDRPGQNHVAVISSALWRSQFGSASSILGRQIQLNREHYTVIGIMPRDFGYPYPGDIPYEHSEFKQTDIWLPAAYSLNQKTNRTDFENADAIARLRPGVSAAVAQAELLAIERNLQPLYPDMWKGFTALVRPLVETIIGPVRKMLWLLLGAVGFVLLIALSNLANLLLARATVRAHELGIRTALGAERTRIVRQLLTESLLLSSLGGALGVALAFAVVHLLTRLNPGNIPRFDQAGLDLRVLLVAVVLSLSTGVAAGLLPSISASRANIVDLIRRAGNRTASGSNTGRFLLIVFEVALSVVLLTGSGLLIRSYLQLQAVNPGFSLSTLTFELDLDEKYNKPELRSALYKRFLGELRETPGVKYVGASNSLPLSEEESVTYAYIPGSAQSKEMVESRSVTPDYRKALGTPLLRGRDFTDDDVRSNAQIAIVNHSFVATYFHNREPLGQVVRLGIADLAKAPPYRIVGMVGDIRHNKLEEPSQPQIFQPADSGNNFAIQSDVPVEQAIRQARAALRALDPVLTLGSVRTMRQRVSEGNARRRFQTGLLTGFAAVAIALALIGLYGIMSYTVKQQNREIGVRLAVGSSPARIVGSVFSQALRLTAAGLVIGLAGALAFTRLLGAWLFGVNALDPTTFIAVPLLIIAVASCACIIPAWSAARVDPVQALRQE